ncbi:MAG: hypothetical protein MI864_16145 [Pseudomonadales bacterium]|nr:hypothetical protein [Pseudomonadales bacterium]
MKALIKINVYGGNALLATLRKHDDLPTGIYSDRPVQSLINLTNVLKANVKLQIETVSLSDNDTSLLVSNKCIQVSELLRTLGVKNFIAFIQDAEKYGWAVEKYIDSINQYFHFDHHNQPLSPAAIVSENVLTFLLFMLMAATPAFVLKIMNSGYLVSPFSIFVLFLGLTTVIYFLSFGIMQYMRTRGEPTY